VPGDIPLRKRLLTQLLAVSALVSVCSIAATAWLAVQTTSGEIRQERGQALSDDTKIYETLLGVAAKTPDWQGATRTVRELSSHTARRIVLTTQDRRVIADSSAPAGNRPAADGAPPITLPGTASAVVDPLAVDLAVVPGAEGRIDPRAVGPFRLPDSERRALRVSAESQVQCMSRYHVDARVVDEASGRPQVDAVHDPYAIESTLCADHKLDEPTRTEAGALASLQDLTNACLKRGGQGRVKLRIDFTWSAFGKEPVDVGDVTSCLYNARREQLRPYVSAPALLFVITADEAAATPESSFSRPYFARLAEVASGVLALTVGVTALAAARLTRPLRALTAATRLLRTGEAPSHLPTPSAAGEIAQLTSAFNDMAKHRLALEEQRKVMVSDVAHELRTPLSNIRLWLQAAEDQLVPADPALIASLLEEAVLLQHIINDLQDLAAADAGTLALHREPVLVARAVDQVAEMQRASAHAAGVQLTVATEGAFETYADPIRLRQMIGNLLSNGIRHTPRGGDVTVHSYETANAAVIEVADTGSGIPPEDLPHVFERFWRADKSRARTTGGSGLGLAIVRNLATAHGGTVTATSTVGEGSVFTITLPRLVPKAVSPALR
jgi:two-component system sensor histidine kinase BaeS